MLFTRRRSRPVKTIVVYTMAASDIQEIFGRAAASHGYLKLKPEQEKAVLSFVGGADVFVCLPTGYGKTLCFALLPRVLDLLCSLF